MSQPCYRPAMDATNLEPEARPGRAGRAPITARWLGRIGYREAWDLQKRIARARAGDGIGDQLLLLEHPAVLTLGRGADEGHVLAPAALLASRGIELLRVERGGEVTYHGPGQLVAYPIVKLADRGLLLRPFVRALEAALVATCAAFGVVADRRDGPSRVLGGPGRPPATQDRRPRESGSSGGRATTGSR